MEQSIRASLEGMSKTRKLEICSYFLATNLRTEIRQAYWNIYSELMGF